MSHLLCSLWLEIHDAELLHIKLVKFLYFWHFHTEKAQKYKALDTAILLQDNKDYNLKS